MATTQALESTLQLASQKNTELLRILSETDHAHPVLEAQRSLITHLTTSLSESDKRLVSLSQKRKKEFHDHEKYRDSLVRRLAYKAAGQSKKFESRAAKEEEEYFDVLKKEQEVMKVNSETKQKLEEVRKYVTVLEGEARRHDIAQRELDSLYEAIFSGPTAALPEEDHGERVVGVRLGEYQGMKNREAAQREAVMMVKSAMGRAANAVASMEKALEYSRFDMFGGGAYADMMERNELHRAETEMIMARMEVVQAQRMDPLVRDLPAVEIGAMQGILGDVFFDNLATDYAMHQRIKEAAVAVRGAAGVLERTLAEADARLREMGEELRRCDKELQQARYDLQKVRERAFERLAEKERAEKGKEGAA